MPRPRKRKAEAPVARVVPSAPCLVDPAFKYLKSESHADGAEFRARMQRRIRDAEALRKAAAEQSEREAANAAPNVRTMRRKAAP